MNEKMQTVIFADDHEILLQGLINLAQDMNLNVLGTAESREETLELIKTFGPPDFLVLDIQMKGTMDGLTTAVRIKKEYPGVKIVILSMHNNREFVKQALKIGVNAYVLKDSGVKEIQNALEALKNNDKYIDSKLGNIIAEILSESETLHPLLSPREIEIIRHIADEKTTAQIAKILVLSKHTIETHRKNILLKLNLKNTAGLIKYAFKNGILH
jgi:DNA-binding NarL/FixJ family response regulator